MMIIIIIVLGMMRLMMMTMLMMNEAVILQLPPATHFICADSTIGVKSQTRSRTLLHTTTCTLEWGAAK